MTCSTCGNKMQINKTGALACSVCGNTKRKVEATKMEYNAFTFYKVKKSLNVVTPKYLMPEEVTELVKKGVEVKIKE